MADRRGRRFRTAAARVTQMGLVCALALTSAGCRTDTPEAGSGVEVAGRSVSMAEVDRAADALCEASRARLREAGQRVPMSSARAQAATALASRLLAEEFAERQDVPAAGNAYRAARTEATGVVSGALGDSFVDLASAGVLLDDVAAAAGRKNLGAQGRDLAGVTDDEASAAGAVLFQEFLAGVESDLTFDPRLGVSRAAVTGDAGAFVPGTSTAASSWALAAQDEEASGADLPDNQVCG